MSWPQERRIRARRKTNLEKIEWTLKEKSTKELRKRWHTELFGANRKRPEGRGTGRKGTLHGWKMLARKGRGREDLKGGQSVKENTTESRKGKLVQGHESTK